jgi:hypothetical protein
VCETCAAVCVWCDRETLHATVVNNGGCINTHAAQCVRARPAIFVAIMSDAPAPVEDAHFVPLSQSQFTWQPGRLVAGRSGVEGNEQADFVSRLAAQHVRYEAFMPRSRSRSPRAIQARGCAQPVLSPASNPVTTSPQGRGAVGQPGVQIPNVPVFRDSAVLVPQGQFDPALRMPGAALQTPP